MHKIYAKHACCFQLNNLRWKNWFRRFSYSLSIDTFFFLVIEMEVAPCAEIFKRVIGTHKHANNLKPWYRLKRHFRFEFIIIIIIITLQKAPKKSLEEKKHTHKTQSMLLMDEDTVLMNAIFFYRDENCWSLTISSNFIWLVEEIHRTHIFHRFEDKVHATRIVYVYRNIVYYVFTLRYVMYS